jgi:hypothetical protein
MSAAHGLHSVPAGPLKPGIHVQFVTVMDAGGELVLLGHMVLSPPWHHAPASHSVQLTPSIPYHVHLQVQSEDVLLPICDTEFGGQTTLEFPPVQYESGGHCVQVSPSSPKYPPLQTQSVRCSLPDGASE